MFAVVVTEKGGGKQRLEFDKELVRIGRVHGNDVILPRANVSKNHAVIERRSDGFILSDMGSTNGTYVNGRRVLGTHELNPDDRVYVGDFILNVESVVDNDSALFDGDTVETSVSTFPEVVSQKVEGLSVSKERRLSIPQPSIKPHPPSEKRIPLPESVSFMNPDSQGNDNGSDQISEPVPPPPIMLSNNTAQSLPRVPIPSAVPQVPSIPRIPTPSALDKAANTTEVLSNALTFENIADLLSNPSVYKISVLGIDDISMLTKDGWQKTSLKYSNDTKLFEEVCDLMEETGNKDANQMLCQTYTKDGFPIFVFRQDFCTVAVIDKCVAMPVQNTDDDLDVLNRIIKAKSNVLVVGRNSSVRRAILFRILELLPKQSFIAAIGDLVKKPNLPGQRTAFVNLHLIQKKNPKDICSALFGAVAMGPDWLAVIGLAKTYIQDVLYTATGRGSVIAEMPLGGYKQLNTELSIALCSNGLSVTSEQAASFISEAFSVVVVAELSAEGTPYIKTIFESALTDTGLWSPRIIYSRDITQ